MGQAKQSRQERRAAEMDRWIAKFAGNRVAWGKQTVYGDYSNQGRVLRLIRRYGRIYAVIRQLAPKAAPGAPDREVGTQTVRVDRVIVLPASARPQAVGADEVMAILGGAEPQEPQATVEVTALDHQSGDAKLAQLRRAFSAKWGVAPKVQAKWTFLATYSGLEPPGPGVVVVAGGALKTQQRGAYHSGAYGRREVTLTHPTDEEVARVAEAASTSLGFFAVLRDVVDGALPALESVRYRYAFVPPEAIQAVLYALSRDGLITVADNRYAATLTGRLLTVLAGHGDGCSAATLCREADVLLPQGLKTLRRMAERGHIERLDCGTESYTLARKS